MPEGVFDPTVAPRWDWLAVGYFFLGGLAGASFFLGAILDLFGREEDRPVVRAAYRVPVPCLLVGAVFLIVDLTHPERFWHMLLETHEHTPMLKAGSPMSVGAWALGLFGGLAALAHAGTWSRFSWLSTGWRRPAIALGGGAFGFFLAAYTGVLLSVTNRPGWSDTPLLGLLFLLSATSSSAALLILRGRRAASSTLEWLGRMDAFALLGEALVLGALVATVGIGVAFTRDGWGWLLALGVGLGGIALPLVVRRRGGRGAEVAAAVLVLAGAFLLRTVIVFSVETM